VLERGSNQQIVVASGQPLLDALERTKLPVQAGCRLGMCGSDPIFIVDGRENLEPAGILEAETVRRLGFAEGTRLACMCRPSGPIVIDLDIPRSNDPAAGSSDPAESGMGGPSFVVVGNGVAGFTFIEQIRTAMPGARISLVGREPHHFYNRMGIEHVIYGRAAMNGLYLADNAWFEQRDVKVWLNTIATRIDRGRKRLVLATGEELAYDKLILATGARAISPSLSGWGLPGCFVLREADDAIRLRSWIQAERCESAVVLGGGVLGIEIAYALSAPSSRFS
jgi:ferredoxin